MKELLGVIFVFAVLPIMIILVLLGLRVETLEQNVSGIAYNVTNNNWLSGNSRFSIRASVDTLITEENQSSYCLPPGSPYIALINQSAENKDIKLSVKITKVFTVTSPWGCVDNVTVTRVK
jgi:cytochrome P450